MQFYVQFVQLKLNLYLRLYKFKYNIIIIVKLELNLHTITCKFKYNIHLEVKLKMNLHSRLRKINYRLQKGYIFFCVELYIQNYVCLKLDSTL